MSTHDGDRLKQWVRGMCAVLVAAFAASWATTAGAQGRPITTSGTQPLAFGSVFPGVPEIVSRTDVLRSGQFQIRGRNNAQVLVTFTLPAALTGPSGASLPLVFGAADGGVSQRPAINTATAFDPRVPLTTTLSRQGRLYLFLGGRMNPPAQQTPGSYSGTITVTVAYTN